MLLLLLLLMMLLLLVSVSVGVLVLVVLVGVLVLWVVVSGGHPDELISRLCTMKFRHGARDSLLSHGQERDSTSCEGGIPTRRGIFAINGVRQSFLPPYLVLAEYVKFKSFHTQVQPREDITT